MALQSIDAGAGIDSAQVQAACEAAITASLGDIGTTCETSTSAAIVTECAQFGAYRTLLHLPDPAKTGELTGATAYTIRNTSNGQYTALYGFTITSDIACTVTWWSANTASISDVHSIAAGGNWTVSPDKNRPFKTNGEEILKLVCSSSSAKLRVTFWAEYINSFNDSP